MAMALSDGGRCGSKAAPHTVSFAARARAVIRGEPVTEQEGSATGRRGPKDGLLYLCHPCSEKFFEVGNSVFCLLVAFVYHFS
jgi:hypothetical protein